MKKIHFTIEENLNRLLVQEDTNQNGQITVEDDGPKQFFLKAQDGKSYEVSGNTALSVLLQEMIVAKDAGKDTLAISGDVFFENPARRLSRVIRERYWQGLVRRIDASRLAQILADSKADDDHAPVIYVPQGDAIALDYYQKAAQDQPELNLQVTRLPSPITPEYVRSINNRPGILSLVLEKDETGDWQGLPFVVPGGRFNEMYGWDSYFISLGLLADGYVELAKNMVEHFIYEIQHYGQILNANRSYYLTRSQPPFLTSMGLAVYEKLLKNAESKAWLRRVFQAAIREYHTVWMDKDRLTETGLSRYYGKGLGMPPETEPGHYDALLLPYAQKAGLNVREYITRYQRGEITEPALIEYFIHDRSVRESGHDTSYRVDDVCAHLNTIDLNALLYKYEIDIASTIEKEFDDAFQLENGKVEKSASWRAKAQQRKALADELLWNETHGLYFDYNFVKKSPHFYESATMFWPLWAGMADEKQAEKLVKNGLALLEMPGGIAACTASSRGNISPERPQRQWDYPFGWAPHQMLLWQGLLNYGYQETAQRLAYKWLQLVAKTAANYNGIVVEKYDVVKGSHKADVEYGNVGADVDQIPREGFGWTNASYQIGLSLLSAEQRAALEKWMPVAWMI